MKQKYKDIINEEIVNELLDTWGDKSYDWLVRYAARKRPTLAKKLLNYKKNKWVGSNPKGENTTNPDDYFAKLRKLTNLKDRTKTQKAICDFSDTNHDKEVEAFNTTNDKDKYYQKVKNMPNPMEYYTNGDRDENNKLIFHKKRYDLTKDHKHFKNRDKSYYYGTDTPFADSYKLHNPLKYSYLTNSDNKILKPYFNTLDYIRYGKKVKEIVSQILSNERKPTPSQMKIIKSGGYYYEPENNSRLNIMVNKLLCKKVCEGI